MQIMQITRIYFQNTELSHAESAEIAENADLFIFKILVYIPTNITFVE